MQIVSCPPPALFPESARERTAGMPASRTAAEGKKETAARLDKRDGSHLM